MSVTCDKHTFMNIYIYLRNFILCTGGIRQSFDIGLQYQLLMSKEQWWNNNWHLIWRVQTAVHSTLDYWISRLFVFKKEKFFGTVSVLSPRWKVREMLTGLGLRGSHCQSPDCLLVSCRYKRVGTEDKVFLSAGDMWKYALPLLFAPLVLCLFTVLPLASSYHFIIYTLSILV